MAACRGRDPIFQAILPMQGKPLNALKASQSTVQRNPLYSAVIDALGVGWESDCLVSESRFSKVLFLFDPDADGIHCGMLALWFFYRWLRPLLDADMIHIAQAPLLELQVQNEATPRYLYDDAEHIRLTSELDASGISYRKNRYRGLASMGADALAECCLRPQTRKVRSMRSRDAEIAIEMVQNLRLGKEAKT